MDTRKTCVPDRATHRPGTRTVEDQEHPVDAALSGRTKSTDLLGPAPSTHPGAWASTERRGRTSTWSLPEGWK